MFIKVLGMLPLKSSVQSAELNGSFLFLMLFISLMLKSCKTSHNKTCKSFQALKWKEKHLHMVINVWSLRSDLERHWFRTTGARLTCHAFICVLILQTDITAEMNTFIVKLSKPILKVATCHCCLNNNNALNCHS